MGQATVTESMISRGNVLKEAFFLLVLGTGIRMWTCESEVRKSRDERSGELRRGLTVTGLLCSIPNVKRGLKNG